MHFQILEEVGKNVNYLGKNDRFVHTNRACRSIPATFLNLFTSPLSAFTKHLRIHHIDRRLHFQRIIQCNEIFV
ncbi:hypothetical protein PsorP6_000857 [Peronosclerospora sorghi]|uniref:Uncharacterized protein n=1 Tax=Peronosclerospora sorghi TaxID=230839 RepID=A0ACC0WWK6_9STRA|nr:hypothetical protein PsorP6_000857 [Peronosclerospora sorghi]